ncbi:helix-turn-helix domain-containing protein [Vallitalea guaymasensis]|uniref:Uncharacterized protein n=2 Tax=Vallitalea guaymasensis TaxID=1185412 RepID=A0A8J8M6Y2_9FIRM|nr:hypothetical protein [Vallitalea guaymasensis]QUH27466.1 hypothetical protein HYG85_00425 [Vallitalea guaymasensis]
MSRNAGYMKKLRKARVERKQCIRCGKPLSQESLIRGVKQCEKCLDYQRKRKLGQISSKVNTTYFYNRQYKKDEIKRKELGNYMVENKITIKDLAKESNLSQRTIQRILYTDANYTKKTKDAINKYLGKELL